MALSDSVLTRFAAATATPDSAVRKQGSSYALGNVGRVGEIANRRKKLLEDAIATGKIKPEQVGQADASLLGVSPLKQSPIADHSMGLGIFGKALSGTGRFLGHLGGDIATATRYLPAGLYNAGKAVVHDVTIPIQGAFQNPAARHEQPKSEVGEKIIAPTLASYKETYGHGPGHFLESFYQHPLGPILDAASLVSLGGSAAARAGGVAVRASEPGSALSRLGERGIAATSREGRAPFVDPITGVSTPREFTPRPVAKLGQVALDRFTKTGADENRLGRIVRTSQRNAQTRRELGLTKAAQFDIAGQEMGSIKAITDLTPDEQVAFNLAQRGINTPSRIDAFQRMVHQEALGDPAAMAEIKGQGVAEEYVRQMGKLPQNVKALILRPNDRMVKAHQVWVDRVQRQQDELGINPEAAASHLQTEVDRLAPYMAKGAQDAPDTYPIKHVYVPSDVARGISTEEPGRLRKLLTGDDTRMIQSGFNPRERAIRGREYADEVLTPEKESWQYHSTGDTFSRGTFRTDSKLYMEHVVKRARAHSDRLFKQDQLNRLAMKDSSGEFHKFADEKELRAFEVKSGMPEGSLHLVYPQGARAYFMKEHNILKDFETLVNKYMEGAGNKVINPSEDHVLEGMLNKLAEADADAFVKTEFSNMKRPGVAIPTDSYNYLVKLAKVDEPFNSGIGRFYSRMMNRWRTSVLTLMPRWALNTAMGSLIMNGIRGVDHRDYWIASKLHKAGYLPDNLAGDTDRMALPTGVRLGHQVMQENLESAAPGYTEGKANSFLHSMGMSVPVQEMQNGVQNIENYFRQGAFIHNLRREQRLARDGQGRVVDLGDDGTDVALGGISEGLDNFYKEILGDKWGGQISAALQDPALVDRALQETDKLMYNYHVLGPTERKFVRQFIPFWGWYKFISMAAYRLPVELPGRMNLLRNLSTVAKEQEDQYGGLPEWLGGMIPFSGPADPNYKYLSTLGLNPFGQVANPIGPEGPIGGLFQLGQLNPALQAGLLGFGVDPLSGEQVPISPESGVGTDPFGNLYKNGRQISPVQASPLQRIGMGLLRSLPQFRLGERYGANPIEGFGAPYPESIPFIAPRPMSEPKGGPNDALLQMVGVGVKSYDKQGYQQFVPRMARYAEKSRQTQIRKLRAKLKAQR